MGDTMNSLTDRLVVRFEDGEEISEVYSAHVLDFFVHYVRLHPEQKVQKVYRRMPGKRIAMTKQFRERVQQPRAWCKFYE